MKRCLLQTLFFSFLLMINFVSAQSYGFGLGYFDISQLIPFAIFVLFFALIFAILSNVRIFNPTIAGIISAAIAFLIYYYGFYQTNFDIQGFFFNFGFSGEIFYPIIGILILIGVAIMLWKIGITGSMMIIGAILISIVLFTDIFFEKGLMLIVGVGMFVLGLLFKLRSKGYSGGSYDWGKEQRQWNSSKIWIFVGLLIMIGGFIYGFGLIALGLGLLMILIGFIMSRHGKTPGGATTHLGRNLGKKAWKGGKWGARQTFGRTKFAKGRMMHKKRAEEEAYKELAKRQEKQAEAMERFAKKLQKEYNRYKKINEDPKALPDVRKNAYTSMVKIAQEAANNGINLRY